MRFIGDVHGKFRQYKKLLAQGGPTIQVGDLGLGFRRVGGYRDGSFTTNPPHARMVAGGHRFIRGNHDNPSVCRQHSQCIQDGTIEDGVMFVGGAVSVDKEWRQPGYNWWEDEELSYRELSIVVDTYARNKPRVMVTHDCPEEIASVMCAHSGRKKLDWPSRTRDALQAMLCMHSPKLWVFGHWHFSFDATANGTRFVCLAELECRDLDTR